VGSTGRGEGSDDERTEAPCALRSRGSRHANDGDPIAVAVDVDVDGTVDDATPLGSTGAV
jgi:hypothetical protein